MSLLSIQYDIFAERPPSVIPSLTPPLPAPAFVNPFFETHRARLDAVGNAPLTWDDARWDHTNPKDPLSAVCVDVEIYWNFLVVAFKRISDGTRLAFEGSARTPLNRRGVAYVMEKNLTVGFNSINFDLLIITMALAGHDTVKLKQTANDIIKSGEKHWQIERSLGIRIPRWDHIDLIMPNPSIKANLKTLNGRLHGRYMVDLPVDEDASLTDRQKNEISLYCHNDLDATELLYRAMLEPIELRKNMSKIYCGGVIDLRSRSDAQVGEAIMKFGVERRLGRRIDKIPNNNQRDFAYEPPAFIKYNDERLTRLVADLASTSFRLNPITEKIESPPILKDYTIKIGNSTYSLGIGGLHSNEAHRSLKANKDYAIIDVDVASQYPNLIMSMGLYPAALGPVFLEIYGALIKERLAAKAARDMVRADGGRVALNGVFGKLGSPYSVLYAPHLLIAITLTGQLSILMLIERAEAAGIPVVSANTDGILFDVERIKEPLLDELLAAWQAETGLVLEKTPYRAIYNASVNSYIAIKENGKVKMKGYTANPWRDGDLRSMMMKNPQMTVCSDAVLKYVIDGTPMHETIRGCTDPRAFVTVIKVTGGGIWRGHALGRAVRYYWSLDGDPIMYADAKRKVSKTDGARPLLELMDALPADIDYERYEMEAFEISKDFGIE